MKIKNRGLEDYSYIESITLSAIAIQMIKIFAKEDKANGCDVAER
jgi:hypothetical protein